MIKIIHAARKHQWLILVMSILTLSACGSSNLTDIEYVQKAKANMDANQTASAIIQLKNALNVNANNLEARWMLGRINVQLGNGATAEKELLKAQSLGLDAKAIIVPLARAYLLQNKFEDTITLEEEGLDNLILAEIKYLKSKAYFGMRNIDAVKENLKQAIELGGDAVIGLTSHSFSEFGEGRNAEALILIEKALQKNGEYVDALILSGDIYLAMKKYIKAEASYQKALNIQKNSPVLKVALAVSQVNNDKLDAAIKNLTIVLKHFPENITANYYRALAAFRKKDSSNAQLYAEKVLNTQSNHLESRLIAAASSYTLKHYEKALKHVTSFLSFVPTHEPAIKLQTASLLALNLFEKAAENAEKFKIETEQDGKMLEAIAISLVQAGDLRGGSQLLEQVVEQADDKAPIYAQLGVINVSRGDREVGMRELEKALELDPELIAADMALIFSYIKEKDFDKAISSAKQFQQKYPNNAGGFTLEAIAQLGNHNREQAKKLFRKAIKVTPGSLDASFSLASIALEDENINEARELYQVILKHSPGHLKALLLLSDLEFKSGNQMLGLKLLEEAKNTNKNALIPRISLARWYISKKQPEKALAATEAVLNKFPRHIQLIDVIAQAQLLAQKTDAAIDSYHKLEELLPRNANIQYQLGQLYSRKNDTKMSRIHVDNALQLDANHRLGLMLSASLAAQEGEFERAKDNLARYKKSNESDASVYELEAKIALAESKPEVAVELYQKALEKSANNILTIQLAQALYHNDESKKAKKVLLDWLGQHAEDDLTRTVLADMLLLDEEYAKASEQYEIINKNSPQNAVVINNLAWLQMQFKNHVLAKTLAQKAMALAPKSPVFVDTYAQILEAGGELLSAIEQYEKASELSPDDLSAKFKLAKILKQSGEHESANELIKQLLDNERFKQVNEAKMLLEK